MRTSAIGLLLVSLAACGGNGAGSGGSGNDTLSGACAAATMHEAPFSVTASADTSSTDLALSCQADATAGQAAHAITLAQAAMVDITASDESGQGVGVEIRTPACAPASVACVWQSNGNVHQSVSLAAGTWVIVVQRKPAGKYSLSASW
jgi:hypothetical protein